MVDQNQLDQDLAYVEIGKDEGARLALGGERLNRATPGFYMAPALFVDADNACASPARRFSALSRR